MIFQTINSVKSNSLSLKYQRFTPSGCKDIRVRKCEFVAKTQFLWLTFMLHWLRESYQSLILGPILTLAVFHLAHTLKDFLKFLYQSDRLIYHFIIITFNAKITYHLEV